MSSGRTSQQQAWMLFIKESPDMLAKHSVLQKNQHAYRHTGWKVENIPTETTLGVTTY